MSSSKKKPILTTCQTCETVILIKDSARHVDICGKSINDIEISSIKSGFLRGFNTFIDKADSFLPPDSVGWEKQHSILLNPQTMEYFDVIPRQPVRVFHFASQNSQIQSFIGVVWPCKEIPLLKMHIISGKVERERLVTLEKLENVEKMSNIGVMVETKIKITPGFRDFLQMYLAYSYLEYENPIEIKYVGNIVKVYATEPIELKMKNMMNENQKKDVITTALGYQLNILNMENSIENIFENIQNLSEIGGMFTTKNILETYILEPIKNLEIPCSLLLWALPGSGKTFILKYLAQILGSSCIFLSNCEELAELETINVNEGNCQCIIVDINEVDKENTKAVKSLNLLLQNEKICVILSVRSSDSLELGLRVRFPVETEITVPTQEERLDILKRIGQKYGFDTKNGLEIEIARQTHGFTASDLCSLLKSAKFVKGETPIDKIEIARKRVRPTGIRQFILEVPNVSWNDICGNDNLKLEIQQAVIWPQKYPEAFERFGIDPPTGILLYGPPGCSKTLIARALANEAKMNFLAVKGPELFSKWVGDSEKGIRDLFARARQVAPTIVFFDEIDAVGSSRGSEKSSGVSDRVLAQLLTELDGLEKSSRVILLAATNRPDQLDSALLRPGRLDRAIHVGLPSFETRKSILEMKTEKMNLEEKVQNVETLVKRTEGYSGAELVAVCRTAAMFAMRENILVNTVDFKHFEQALSVVVPRTETYLLDIYEDFKAGKTSNA